LGEELFIAVVAKHIQSLGVIVVRILVVPGPTGGRDLDVGLTELEPFLRLRRLRLRRLLIADVEAAGNGRGC
jgi:hypothetical protein